MMNGVQDGAPVRPVVKASSKGGPTLPSKDATPPPPPVEVGTKRSAPESWILNEKYSSDEGSGEKVIGFTLTQDKNIIEFDLEADGKASIVFGNNGDNSEPTHLIQHNAQKIIDQLSTLNSDELAQNLIDVHKAELKKTDPEIGEKLANLGITLADLSEVDEYVEAGKKAAG